ncbi:Re1-silencing transcription factor [Plakobranchus ocellatus]|uniref:Re1-silencing transcription factor n=1 Tax=Plakobranchus ocellatus TaxID=259542 RepID=A0AAV3YP75_9GAST|nr:Re1-silencing transcription factor [Plakobranchus ocellatus]
MADSSNKSDWERLGVSTCDSCNFKTTDLGLYQAHHCPSAVISYNLVNSKFLCSLCRAELTESAFEEHLEQHLSPQPYSCYFCNAPFKTREDVYVHARQQTSRCKPNEQHPGVDECILRVSKKVRCLMLKAKSRGKSYFKPTHAKYVPPPFGIAPQSDESMGVSSFGISGFRNIAPKPRTNIPVNAPAVPIPASSPSLSVGEQMCRAKGKEKRGASKGVNLYEVQNKTAGDNSTTSEGPNQSNKSVQGSKDEIPFTLPITPSKPGTNPKIHPCTSASKDGPHKAGATVSVNDSVQRGCRKVFEESDSFLVLTKGNFICLACQQRWRKVDDFIKHISYFHIHDHTSVCCGPKVSVKCKRLQAVLKILKDRTMDEQMSLQIERFIVRERLDECKSTARDEIRHEKLRTSSSETVSNLQADLQKVFNHTSDNNHSPSDLIKKDQSIKAHLKDVKGNFDHSSSACVMSSLDSQTHLPNPTDSRSLPQMKKDGSAAKKNASNITMSGTSLGVCTAVENLSSRGFTTDRSYQNESSMSVGSDYSCTSTKEESRPASISSKKSTSFSKEPRCHDKENIDVVVETDEDHNPVSDARNVSEIHSPAPEIKLSVKQEVVDEHLESNNFTSESSVSHKEQSFSQKSPQHNFTPAPGMTGQHIKSGLSDEAVTTRYHPPSFYQCGFYNCVFSSHLPVDLLLHSTNAHPMEENFPCVYCGKLTRTVSGLLEHMDTHVGHDGLKTMHSYSLINDSRQVCIAEHRNLKKVIDTLKTAERKRIFPQGQGTTVRYRCNLCSSDFSSLEEVKGHVNKSLLKVVACKYCRGHFLDSVSWQEHMTKGHSSEAKQYRINEKLLCGERKSNSLIYEILSSKRKTFRLSLYQQTTCQEIVKDNGFPVNTDVSAPEDKETVQSEKISCTEDIDASLSNLEQHKDNDIEDKEAVHIEKISCSENADASPSSLPQDRDNDTEEKETVLIETISCTENIDVSLSSLVQDKGEDTEDKETVLIEVINCTENTDSSLLGLDKDILKEAEDKKPVLIGKISHREGNDSTAPEPIQGQYKDTEETDLFEKISCTEKTSVESDSFIQDSYQAKDTEPTFEGLPNDSSPDSKLERNAVQCLISLNPEGSMSTCNNQSKAAELHKVRDVEGEFSWDEASMPVYFKCTVCPLSKFSSYFLAVKHKKTHVEIKAGIRRVPNCPSFEPSKTYKCNFCAYICAGDLSIMKVHLHRFHKHFRCELCGDVYAKKLFIENHLKYHHRGQKGHTGNIIVFLPKPENVFHLQPDQNNGMSDEVETPLYNESTCRNRMEQDRALDSLKECTEPERLNNVERLSRKRQCETDVLSQYHIKRQLSDNGQFCAGCSLGSERCSSAFYSKDVHDSVQDKQLCSDPVTETIVSYRHDESRESSCSVSGCAELPVKRSDSVCDTNENTTFRFDHDTLSTVRTQSDVVEDEINSSECKFLTNKVKETRIRLISSSYSVSPKEIKVAEHIIQHLHQDKSVNCTMEMKDSSGAPPSSESIHRDKGYLEAATNHNAQTQDGSESSVCFSASQSMPKTGSNLKDKKNNSLQRSSGTTKIKCAIDFPFQCNECRVSLKCIDDVVDHIKWLHPVNQENILVYDRRSKLAFNKEGSLFGGSNGEILHKHFCKACNFRSHNRSDVEKHVKSQHPSKEREKCILSLHTETADSPADAEDDVGLDVFRGSEKDLTDNEGDVLADVSIDSVNNVVDDVDICNETDGDPQTSAVPKTCLTDQTQSDQSSTLAREDVILPAPASAKLPSPRYRCHLCPEVLHNEFFFKLHLGTHGGFSCTSVLSSTSGILRCTICGYIAGSSNDFAQHMFAHPIERRFACSRCDVDSHTKGGLLTHIKKCHNGDLVVRLIDRKKERDAVEIRPKIVDLDPSLYVADIFDMPPRHLARLLRQNKVKILNLNPQDTSQLDFDEDFFKVNHLN